MYKYSFYSNVISPTGEVSNLIDRVFHLNLKSKEAEKMPLQKIKGHYLVSNQKLASTQTIGSASWKEFVRYKTRNLNMVC